MEGDSVQLTYKQIHLMLGVVFADTNLAMGNHIWVWKCFLRERTNLYSGTMGQEDEKDNRLDIS
jgi:hypothetical protein